jgi:hypothetical protein
MPDDRSKYKRTNLFLLRVLCDDTEENEHMDSGEEYSRTWHGTVQRAVSGEAYSFEGKEALIEVIEAMIYKGGKTGWSLAVEGKSRHERKQARKPASGQVATTLVRQLREVT